MNSSLALVLGALQASRYLEAHLAASVKSNKVVVKQLLPHSIRFCDQLVAQWQITDIANVPLHFFKEDHPKDFTKDKIISSNNRLAFITSTQFIENMHDLLKNSSIAQCPVLIKSKIQQSYMSPNNNFIKMPASEDQEKATYLISDYFFNASLGLEKFYNIQRERKIWWMRFSANPSRYFLEPFDLLADAKVEKTLSHQCQSITIKSRFPFGIADVEHVTLVPLLDAFFEKEKGAFEVHNFRLTDEKSVQPVLPAVIRSVIHLEYAACAMLLDGYDHNRKDTLLLNRKLAPIQCMVACLHRDNTLDDLRDLCTHLSFVMRSAGLRLFDKAAQTIFTNSKTFLKTELQEADRVGIPYVIIIEEDSLQTGLLKLRNRDTTLEETIHISDISSYLLKIFAN